MGTARFTKCRKPRAVLAITPVLETALQNETRQAYRQQIERAIATIQETASNLFFILDRAGLYGLDLLHEARALNRDLRCRSLCEGQRRREADNQESANKIEHSGPFRPRFSDTVRNPHDLPLGA